ncbi:hypothetical protein SAMN05428957_10918 [Oryzisolibacter propanilivorax]|uniref:Uncharacterized protein n=1 Tax=Oryzisolibacter propanilivorax TaxID=1527607 RepID=A0A1G9UJR5_9BURK|nr:hypothetical protein [Oryzisolibacter propanilivorax]SDM60044.1 hypothetical protein SAMN05428957_10918 [Oryzisolibacter propanilivorax]
MIFVKTLAGQQALKERQSGALAPRQRPAFILFDGRRSTDEVLAATAAMGITRDDVQAMLERGLLAPVDADALAPVVALEETPAAPEAGERSSVERYQAAYPIAIELTAGLGLRGFRLNLAVEGTSGYRQLAELAPRIRDAVGEARYARLAGALFD